MRFPVGLLSEQFNQPANELLNKWVEEKVEELTC